MQQVLVDGKAEALPTGSAPLVVAPGLHRLDIDFALVPGPVTNPVEVRCRLEGIDDAWRPAVRGMWLICEVLGDGGRSRFARGVRQHRAKPGWVGDPNESRLSPRLEPLFFPGNAQSAADHAFLRHSGHHRAMGDRSPGDPPAGCLR